MVELGGGQDGPIEHGFSNSVFIVPGIIIVGLAEGIHVVPPPNPTTEELLKMIEGMTNIKPEDRENLIRSVLGQGPKEVAGDITAAGISQMGLLLVLVGIVTLVFDIDRYAKRWVEDPSRKEEIIDSVLQDVKEQIKHDHISYFTGPAAFLTCFASLSLLFVFFGYKLYVSVTEKEKRRDEKRRQKQLKKKK